MKKLLCVFLALVTLMLTGCEKGDIAAETTSDTTVADITSTALLETVSESFEIVQYYTIDPDKTIWTEFFADDGSLSFMHNELDGVTFNIAKNDLSDDEEDITIDEWSEIIKNQCAELGIEILGEEVSQIGGEKWSGVLVDLGDGERMKMLSTVKNRVYYNIILFLPNENYEKALADIESALETFEFTE